ncbi:glycerophosphodiester phosphodiesterase [Ilumatobacter sp.]|uniref:glycerophosphodiester phosphodiesterase n=1 Tax=Ilumatobacter sp. TaxID=1967498 RepID=UPI003751A020
MDKRLPEHPYLNWSGPIAFAHRGGNRTAPENTMAAFEHAACIGFRYLETDVHRSADGVLVAFHDENLLRTCGLDANIADLTWAQIAQLRVDGTEPIPRMVDLFERFPEHRFNIDCKADAALEPLVELINTQGALDRVCVGSFSFKRLQTMRRRLGPGSLTCLSPIETVCLLVFGRLFGSAQRAAQVPPGRGRITVVSRRFIRNARRAGIPVHVWTINDAAEINRLLDLGVDGVMTDDVDLLRSVYAERGVWVSDT